MNMKKLDTNPEQVQPAKDHEPMPESSFTNQEVDEQRKLRRAYCEQLRRMACPNCGDGEPQF